MKMTWPFHSQNDVKPLAMNESYWEQTMHYAVTMFIATVATAIGGDEELMDDYSAVVPLTLEKRVMRLVAAPPEGTKPNDIMCDIGVTGTVLTNARGVPSHGDPETVIRNMVNNDKVDVLFSDRYLHRRGGEHKTDFYVGLKVKYLTKLKVAQVEIRGVYSLPSGDLEPLTYKGALRKRRLLRQQLNKCNSAHRACPDLREEVRGWERETQRGNNVHVAVASSQLHRSLGRLNKAERYASRIPEIERDLDAFNAIDEYLKVKIHGSAVYVRFHTRGETIPVDVGKLRKRKIIPIRVSQ